MSTPGTLRVLVVDDDEEVRSVLVEYLGRHGCAVTSADGTATAREHLAAEAFDLAVVDVIMPGEDGLSLARHIRESLGIAIIMLTAVDTALDRAVGFAVGADDYVTKPFHPRELMIRIESLLGRSAAKARTDAAADGEIWLGCFCLDVEQRTLRHRDGGTRALTPAESTVLQTLVQRVRQTVDRHELMTALGISERGVDLVIHRLRRKIEPDPRRPAYLRTVAGSGYMLVPGTGADGG